MELKPERHRPKARYAHSLARMDGRVFLFGGESNTGAPGIGKALALLFWQLLNHCCMHVQERNFWGLRLYRTAGRPLDTAGRRR